MKLKTLNILIALLLLTSTAKPDWQRQNSGITRVLYSIYFINETTGWISAADGKILSTTNGGINWTQQVSNTTSSLYCIDFSSSLTGYAGGSSGTFVKTTNGGASWTPGTITGFSDIQGIDFIDNNTGYACGGAGTGYAKVAKTTDGGTSWQIMNVEFNSYSTDIKAFDANTVVVSEYSGRVYKTINGGINWTLQVTGNTNWIRSIAFSDINHGFFSTYSSTQAVYGTTNGGTTWQSVLTLVNPVGVNGLSMVNSNIVYGVTGYPPAIRRTTNGGISWEVQPHGDSTTSLWDVFMVNANVGYVCGNGGTIFKTQNGGVGIQQISGIVPKGYSLSQNYPNPFNPSTKIKFSIPERQNIAIKVFDVAGREIETLVNEALAAGTYEADFNASKLSSGIYFYRIIAAGYSETKKMMLVK